MVLALLGTQAIADTTSAADGPQIVRDRLVNGTEGPQMIVLPAGSFWMGSSKDEPGRAADEGPRHEAKIVRAFAISRYEVSVREYRQFVDSTGYRTDAEIDGGCLYYADGWQPAAGKDWRSPPGFDQMPDHPVVCVSLNDATAYVRWLS